MTIRKILTFPDPKLREVAKEVTNFDSNLKQLADDLLDTMYEFKGIGLAAIQIGVRKRIIVAGIFSYVLFVLLKVDFFEPLAMILLGLGMVVEVLALLAYFRSLSNENKLNE